MSSAGPVDFFVDIDKLTELGQEIQSLITALNGLVQGSCPDGTQTGSQDVSDAVHRFESSWGSARLRLIDQLTACLGLVRLAAQNYRRTEEGLRSGLLTAHPQVDGSERT
jgi:hypothetical protein